MQRSHPSGRLRRSVALLATALCLATAGDAQAVAAMPRPGSASSGLTASSAAAAPAGAVVVSRPRSAVPARATLFATVAPSPFVPLHGQARIQASITDPGGRPVGVGALRVSLASAPPGVHLEPPTATGRREGVVARLVAGASTGRARITVTWPGTALRQTLPVEVYSTPARLVAGKGAWVSFSTYAALGPSVILHRLAQEGVTHMYLETTGYNFAGRPELNALLEQAHNLGIAVIDWAWAPLNAVAREVQAASATIAYAAPHGGQADGLGGDFEIDLGAAPMQAFSRAVRRALGPERVYVGIVYPPQAGFPTPIAAMAKYVNVFAPMDYWLQAPRAYTPAQAAAYVVRSIQALRQAPGEDGLPIEVVSQTQNVENRSGFGRYNPPPDQVTASARAAVQAGAIGVSFYDLRTQTPAQIAAIAAFAMPAAPSTASASASPGAAKGKP